MRPKRCDCFLFLFCLLVSCVSSQVIDLSATSWTLSNERGYNNVTVAGQVPGDSFTDLMAANIIDDPYYRYNDMNYRWISLDNWTYSADIQLPSSVFSHSRVVLWFEGLDTIATVKVNGEPIGNSDNMFRRWVYDFKHLLNPNNAKISVSIEFSSSASYAKQKADETNYRIPESTYQTGIPNRNFIRTSQCHFAWDWGPCFLTQGAWQAASIRAFSDAIIQYVAPQIVPEDSRSLNDWNVNVDVWLLPANTELTGSVSIDLYDVSTQVTDVTLSGLSSIVVPLQLSITSLPGNDLWWPRGYGSQSLHPLTVSFFPNTNTSAIQQNKRLVGFRSVEIIQETLPKQREGLSFYIQVNNVPVFAKGANWIPADAFESRVTPEVLEELLQSAYDANMNTVRNWGGGIYQHDLFYEICDKKGLMVWEEFMFACSMYPRDEEFLLTVREEVKHQVLRLMSHPSIIIWSGNNENELALGSSTATAWYVETTINPFRYVVDYSYLNTDTVYDTIHQYDPSRPWLPSSPSNGILSTEPYVERWGNPASPNWGDVHFYDYTDLCTDVSIYPTPRFASEYGFQSYPNFRSMAEISLPEDWNPNSKFLLHRQHHPDGNGELDRQIKQHFRYPNSTDSKKMFSDWLYLTQCVHALCLRTESEHYRRQKGEEAHTMGALYWQLNSIWQAPTWSSIEYGNKWKMAHYFAAEFFAETIISSFVTPHGDYSVSVTTDDQNSQDGEYTISAVGWNDDIVRMQWAGNYSLTSLASAQVFSQSLSSMLKQANANETEIFFTLEWSVNSSGVIASNTFFLTSFVNVKLLSVSFDVVVIDTSENDVNLLVTCSAVAPYTLLTTSVPGRFSSNGFLCRPSVPVSVTFFGKSSFSSSEFTDTMTIHSIQTTY